MSKDTKIEWADSTVNPTMGCGGCELWNIKTGRGTCYAALLTERYKGNKGYSASFGEVALFPDRMTDACKWTDLKGKSRKNKPWLENRPRHIFVGDMGDLFCDQVDPRWIWEHVFKPMYTPEGRRHVWILCTKRAAQIGPLHRFITKTQGTNWPKNLIVLSSITSQHTEHRAAQFAQLPDDVRVGLSVEPLLEEVELFGEAFIGSPRAEPYEWVIVGAESGPDARSMNDDWVRSIRDGCQEWDIPFFFKQGRSVSKQKVSVPALDGSQWTQMPRVSASPMVAQPEDVPEDNMLF